MKKSILLFCIAALAVGSTASAAEIDAKLILRKVDVKVTDTKNSQTPAIQLLNSDKTKMLYTDEGINENGDYLFDSFSFPMDAQSGSYVLRVGEDGNISEISIKYTAYDEAIRALETIKNDKSTISAQISAYPELFGTNDADFEILGEDWKKRLEKDISETEIKDENEEEAVSTINIIQNIVRKITDWAKLTDSADEQKTESAIKAVSGLDLTYREKLSSVSVLAKAFEAQSLDRINIDENGILNAFDGAMLVSVINECDWGTGKTALTYYVEKGLLSIDSKYLSSDAEVYKKLKNKKILDYKKLPQAIKEAYDEIHPSGNGSGAGGGSGSGGGGTSINKVNSVNSAVSSGQMPEVTSKVVFNDLDGAEWARKAIEALAEKKIVSGRGDGRFEPNEPLTRAEFVKIIVDAFDLKDNTAEIDFDDVPKDAWSYRYIASAKKAGIIYGISDTHFGADKTISRQDMAVILLRTAELKGIDTSGNGVEFTDSQKISDYARDAVGRLSAAGILNGMNDGSFSPLTDVTRAQGAQVIYTMLGRKG